VGRQRLHLGQQRLWPDGQRHHRRQPAGRLWLRQLPEALLRGR